MPNNTLAALDALPLESIPAAIAALCARLLTQPQKHDDRLLTAAEAAKELKVSTRYVWKHWRQLGGTRLPNGRGLRFPRAKLRRRVA